MEEAVLTTRFTELVGCTVPLQMAPMGDFARAPLAAAVSNAGGLGMVTVVGAPAGVVIERIEEALEHTFGPVGANFFLPFADPETLAECVSAAAAHAKIVDFFYADPDPALVRLVHAAGGLASWQVGSVEEARAAADAGCDFIVAQGVEAGGHVRCRIGLLPLLDGVLNAVAIPVVAAGGIGSGRSMAAALVAGADGVRIGTRLIAAEESGAHPEYVAALIAASPAETTHGDHFVDERPGLPHRALSSAVFAVAAFEGDVVGEHVDPRTGGRTPVPRFQKMTVTRDVTGTVAAMSQWAGESVGMVTRVQPAAEIVLEMAEEAERLLRRWSPA
jgi:nitronate monooxygenase